MQSTNYSKIHKEKTYKYGDHIGFVKHILTKGIKNLEGQATYIFGQDDKLFITTDENVCALLLTEGYIPLDEETLTRIASKCQHIVDVEQYSTFRKDEMSTSISSSIDFRTIIASANEDDLVNSLETILRYQDNLRTQQQYPFVFGNSIDISAYDMGPYPTIKNTVGGAPHNTLYKVRSAIRDMENKRYAYDNKHSVGEQSEEDILVK